MLLQANQRIGPYTLVHALGKGSFGVVWLAEKRGLITTQVALKIPLASDYDLDQIRQEAEIWLRASGHPNVLPVLEADVYGGQVVIASEYAPGGTLADWLNAQGGKTPSIEAAVHILSGILAGLEHLHNLQPKPMIHRDLKPANVLMQGETPRLTDFGISRVFSSTAFTQTASGTPAYMPPEAFDGHFSPQTDIWAAGVILYRMLTGALPFAQTSTTALIGAICRSDPAPLPAAVPAAMKKVVARALAKDRKYRFASAQEMRAALLQAAHSIGNTRIPYTPAMQHNPLAHASQPSLSSRLSSTSGPTASAGNPSYPLHARIGFTRIAMVLATGMVLLLCGLIVWGVAAQKDAWSKSDSNHTAEISPGNSASSFDSSGATSYGESQNSGTASSYGSYYSSGSSSPRGGDIEVVEPDYSAPGGGPATSPGYSTSSGTSGSYGSFGRPSLTGGHMPN